MSSADFVQPIRSTHQTKQRRYQELKIIPVNGALGAEVEGIDLASQLNTDNTGDIRQALLDHMVLVFRDQSLSPLQLAEISSRFGKLHINPFVSGTDGVKEVISIRSEENHEKRFTGLWHSDISWDEKPSLGSLLYAVNLPDCGGDTLFSNMVLAYETLSDGYKKLINSRNAMHRVDRYHSSKAEYADVPSPVMHPIVRTHPETRQKALFVNEYFTSCIENMSEEESAPILSYLFQHSIRPDFTCRIQWRPGTLVFWDNRCTQHYATNDYAGQSRLMHRVTIMGDRPF